MQNTNSDTCCEIAVNWISQNFTYEKSYWFQSNGLVPLRQQAITWANVDPDQSAAMS